MTAPAQLMLPTLAAPAAPHRAPRPAPVEREVRITARDYRGTYADGRVWRTRMYLRDGVTVRTADTEE